MIVNGDFDYVLVKPVSALFRVLLGGADIVDFITIPPLLAALIYFGIKLDPGVVGVITYILLVANGLIISAAFHIIVLSMAIITMEIDHSVMIYRDLVSLGRLPIDIYKEPLKGFLTYIIPVGIMITLPVKSLLGIAGIWLILGSFAIGLVSVLISLRFWNFALKKYSSASS
jgi:ABC-2 type transport system permease protein